MRIVLRRAPRILALALAVSLLGPWRTEAGREERAFDEEIIVEHARAPRTGDLDDMLQRGFIRILTTYNPLLFFNDGPRQFGLSYEAAMAFEAHINEGRRGRRVYAIIIPTSRDKLLPWLVEGRGDIAVANLTITSERQQLVDFSASLYPGVDEVIVTGSAAPPVASLDDLVATGLFVRPSSSYFEHLTSLNRRRARAGRPEIPVRTVDERLEDHDLLDLVNAGLLPAIIVDSHKAAFWAQIFDRITVHDALTVNTGGKIAWAVRKNNPRLLDAINGFVKTARKGTLLGNTILLRYLKNTVWIDNARSGEARERYGQIIEIIKRHAAAYDFDWLMIAAQGYQESKLDQSKRSRAGAIGIMQVLPSTAADPNVGIADIETADNNVHAGVRYLRFLRDRYFDGAEIGPLDRVLFSLAAYNAGPRNIARARKKAAAMGLDSQTWFGNVEVATSRIVSREPVRYVRNIYKYYIAYKLLEEERAAREAAISQQREPSAAP
ncbi:MAG: lytic transglycosylase F [Rhodospirillales bacterium]|nr:MAG: lytic transglycosylase F [Rhodospirillales bacterium]